MAPVAPLPPFEPPHGQRLKIPGDQGRGGALKIYWIQTVQPGAMLRLDLLQYGRQPLVVDAAPKNAPD
jgi:hypothetical protein